VDLLRGEIEFCCGGFNHFTGRKKGCGVVNGGHTFIIVYEIFWNRQNCLIVHGVLVVRILCSHLHNTGPAWKDQHESIMGMKVFKVLGAALVSEAHGLGEVDYLLKQAAGGDDVEAFPLIFFSKHV
jgi:hypothetical protein